MVEVEYLDAEQVFVLGLQFVALCRHQVLAGLVVFHGVGLAAFVFLAGQAERLVAGRGGGTAAVVAADGGGGVVPGLLYFLIQGFLGLVQLQGVVLALEAGGADAVARGQAVEEGDAEAEAYVLAEVVLHLLAEAAVQGGVVAGAQAAVEAELRIVRALCDADAVQAAFQPVLGGLDGGFVGQGYLVDFVRGREGGFDDIGRRLFHQEAFRRVQFDELGQVQQGQAVVVVGLHHLEFVLGDACPGFGHLGGRGLAHARQALEAGQLFTAQVGLPLGDAVQFAVEQHLQVGRGDVDGDVLLGLGQVGQRGLQVQLGQGILVGDLQPGEEGDAGADGEAGVVVLGVDVDGVVLARLLVGHGGLRAAPAPALAGAAVERRQAGPLGCVHVHAALLGLVGRLPDGDVVGYGVVDALFQRPAFLCRGACRGGQEEQEGRARPIYIRGVHLHVVDVVGCTYCSFSPLRMRSVVVMPSRMAMRMPSLMPTRTGRRSNCCPFTLSVRT